MSPTLEPDDCVLVCTRAAKPLAVGDIVVAHDPQDGQRTLVKRVGSLGTGSFAVTSDNPASARDSRQFGSLAPEHLIGPATLVFTRKGRIRPLAGR